MEPRQAYVQGRASVSSRRHEVSTPGRGLTRMVVPEGFVLM